MTDKKIKRQEKRVIQKYIGLFYLLTIYLQWVVIIDWLFVSFQGPCVEVLAFSMMVLGCVAFGGD